MTQLHDKIRILLANQEWTQKQLAERLCVSPDTVSSWVRGVNHPGLETIKQLCEIFCIPIEELANDDTDIPEYFIIGRSLPEPMCRYPEEYQDSEHVIIDAVLADEGMLHRYRNCAGAKCSAIYRGGNEVWWHYREHEARMIRDWNKMHSNGKQID